jgi:hypothetical protein
MTDDNNDRETIAQWIARHGVTIEATPIPARPDANGDEWHKGAAHFIVRFGPGDGPVTFYSVGSGIVDRFAADKALADPLIRDFRTMRPRTLAHEGALDKWRPKYRPGADDVLDSLVSDASALDSTFEDWCGDCGYDTDSRKAFATFETCQRLGRELRAWVVRQFGADAWSALVECERL